MAFIGTVGYQVKFKPLSEPIAGEVLTYLWSKKIGQQKVTRDLSKNMLPQFDQTHLQQHLTQTLFLVLSLLLNVLQSSKQVKLEHLAGMFPYPITIESRRWNLPQLRLDLLWYPLITYWLTTYYQVGQTLAIVIARTQWTFINLLMVSLVWEYRAIPLYGTLLPKLGSSNVIEQISTICQLLPLLKDYQVVVLGDA